MIRPILAILFASTIVLFVWKYAEFTNNIRPERIQIKETDAEGQYSIRVFATCACQGNAFGMPAIKVEFRGREIIERNDLVPAGEKLVSAPISDVKQGLNDFNVQVTPVESNQESGNAFSLDSTPGIGTDFVPRVVIIQVMLDGAVIAKKTILSESAGPFGELIKIEVAKTNHAH